MVHVFVNKVLSTQVYKYTRNTWTIVPFIEYYRMFYIGQVIECYSQYYVWQNVADKYFLYLRFKEF